MAGKLSFLIGLGAGYVLGARSGRERYEQIAGKAQELWRDPRVQDKAEQAQHLVKEKASDVGGRVSEKVTEKIGSGGAHAAATNGSGRGVGPSGR